MFKHILIPTDGSRISARAVKAGIALAKVHGARVTGYHAVEPVPAHLYGEGYVADRRMVAEFERRQREAAKKHLAAIARQARKAGVRFDPVADVPVTAYDGIVQAASRRKCDLILMSSHGYRGFNRLLLGSVTDKVIQRSRVPVLVFKA